MLDPDASVIVVCVWITPSSRQKRQVLDENAEFLTSTPHFLRKRRVYDKNAELPMSTPRSGHERRAYDKNHTPTT